MNHKYSDSLTFKIENETDLHTKVVSFLKKRYPHSIFSVGLGENQDSVNKRIDSFKKGYLRGTPDIIVHNLHKHYTGLAIEFKSPNRRGVMSDDQSKMLMQYQNNGFKTIVSNDYDYIIQQLIEYFRDVRIMCSYCPRRFISSQSLKSSSIDFGIYLHTIFHLVFTFMVQSPQNLRSNPYNRKLENGSSKFFFGIYLHDKNRSKAL